MFTDTELYRHAERELDLLIQDERDRNMNRPCSEIEEDFKKFGGMTPQEFINGEVLKIISVIDPKIHSTKSILHALDIVYRLVQLENLLPLTLDDAEFIKVLDDQNGDTLYQNTRNIKVFKTRAKGVYHVDGKGALDMATGNFGEKQEAHEVCEKQMSIFDYSEDGSVKDNI